MDRALVSTGWLAEHLDDPSVRIVEVSSSEEDSAYREAHIPGALWWYWKKWLWHETDRQFPLPEEMAQRLGSIGVSPETTLVLYGDPVQFGTYAFWVLTMCGHPNIRLLDGGRTAWMKEGKPVSTDIPKYAPVPYAPQAGDPSCRMSRDEVRAGLGGSNRLLLDVRSPEEYRGERVSPLSSSSTPSGLDHGAERKGRIPGARHLYYRELVNEDDTYKSPEELRSLFEAVGATPDRAEGIVTYCRLSHRGTLGWFAMRFVLGYENVRVYDGSWTEWGSIVGFPVEK